MNEQQLPITLKLIKIGTLKRKNIFDFSNIATEACFKPKIHTFSKKMLRYFAGILQNNSVLLKIP